MKNVVATFLSLTSRTYPYGSEKYLFNKIVSEYGFSHDEHGNIYKVIKTSDDNLPTTMFTAHVDTVVVSRHFSWFCKKFKLPVGKNKPVNHIFSKNDDFVKTDERTTLGADDKAGVAIILEMVHKEKVGVYYLFKGEEVGRIGSRLIRHYYFEQPFLRNVTKCISLDRRGYTSVITHQRFNRTCSDEFATELCKKLNPYGFWFSPDPTGMGTDSVSFIDRISECTNVSVGYFKEHTNRECQDLEFLETLTKAFLGINFEAIVTKRDYKEGKTGKYGFNDFSYKKQKDMLGVVATLPYKKPKTTYSGGYAGGYAGGMVNNPPLKTTIEPLPVITLPVKDDEKSNLIDLPIINIEPNADIRSTIEKMEE